MDYICFVFAWMHICNTFSLLLLLMWKNTNKSFAPPKRKSWVRHWFGASTIRRRCMHLVFFLNLMLQFDILEKDLWKSIDFPSLPRRCASLLKLPGLPPLSTVKTNHQVLCRRRVAETLQMVALVDEARAAFCLVGGRRTQTTVFGALAKTGLGWFWVGFSLARVAVNGSHMCGFAHFSLGYPKLELRGASHINEIHRYAHIWTQIQWTSGWHFYPPEDRTSRSS